MAQNGEKKRISFTKTAASDVDVDTLPSYITFVKLENLIEVPFQVVRAELSPSDFNPEKECARVQFEYLDTYGEIVSPDEDEEGTYQFTTEQRAIKTQVGAWEVEGIDWSNVTVGPLTISIYGQPNRYGNHPLCFTEYVVEEKDQVKPTRGPVPSRPIHRDTGENDKRQQLAGKSTIPNARTQVRNTGKPAR